MLRLGMVMVKAPLFFLFCMESDDGVCPCTYIIVRMICLAVVFLLRVAGGVVVAWVSLVRIDDPFRDGASVISEREGLG